MNLTELIEDFKDVFEYEPRTLLLTRSELQTLCKMYSNSAIQFLKETDKFEERGIDPTQEEAEEFGSG